MSKTEDVASGAPRSAIARLMEQWREEADKSERAANALPAIATIPRQELRLTASVLRACADQLDAALRACAEARPSTDKEAEDALSRVPDGDSSIVSSPPRSPQRAESEP